MNGTEQKYVNHFPSKHFPYIAYSISITVGILFLTGISEALITFQIPESYRKEWVPYTIGIGQLLFMLLPTLLAAKQSPIPFDELIRIRKYSNTRIYGIAILGLIAIQLFIPAYAVLQEQLIPDNLIKLYKELLDKFENIYTDLLGGTTVTEAARALLIGALIPAVCEEILFRGFLQRSLEERLKPIMAIFITSIIFAFCHFNPINFTPLTAMGFFFGIIAYSTGSLILPMLLHFLNNALTITIMYIPSMNEIDQSASSIPWESALIMMAAGILLTAGCSAAIFKAGRGKI